MGESFGQLAAVSAVLGGFAVTFMSVVLTHSDARRRVSGAVALATAASACFFLTALGWALLASQAAKVAGSAGADREFYVRQLAAAQWVQRPVSMLFLLGVLLLLLTLGASGWLRSRRLGAFTAAVASASAVTAWVILRPFIH